MKKQFQHKITIGRNLDGTAIRKAFYSSKSKSDAKKKAEAWLVNQKAHQIAGVSITDENILFDSWARHWLEVYKKPTVSAKTYNDTYLQNVEKYLIPYFSSAPLRSIKPVDITAFFSTKTGFSQSLLDKLRLCLNQIFEAAIDNDYCSKNPCRKISPKGNKAKAMDTYTKDERDTLIEYAKFHRYGIMIWILLECGLRPGELLGLKKSDFNIKNKVLRISRAVSEDENKKPIIGPPKTDQSIRSLPISTELAAAINNIETDSDSLLFCTQNGGIMSERSFTRNRYNVFFEDLNKVRNKPIRKLNPYAMRHTCATLNYEKSKDIYALSKFLGHASVEITASTYVHTNVEQLRKHLKVV